MERGALLFYLAIGFGLLFLLPLADTLDKNLQIVAAVLVAGYWGLLGLFFLILLFKSFFAEYVLGALLYNIWLFVSLMCVAVGVLALLDSGVENAAWAIWLVLYGTLVGILKRNEL